ncbi:MAG: hypothetical protein M1839_005384 [Geoglossum umbratile]|nr:MAG: hypothetical protein M1839_005384 [Geoglossum umbratile]
MEPLSSVFALGVVVKSTAQAFRDIRDAPAHVDALREEVSSFEHLVERIQEHLQRNSVPDRDLRNIEAEIEQAGETVQKLNKKLESVQGLGKRRASGLKWVLTKSKCLKLQGRLRRHNQVLATHVQLIQMGADDLMNRILRHPQMLEFVVQMDQEMGGQAELAYLDSSDSTDTAPPSPPTVTESSVLRLNRRACRSDCSCKCHTTASYRWPDSLSLVTGNTHLNFIGQPKFIRRCSRHDCRKAKVWSGELIHVFPSWLLKKMISVSMISHGFKRTFHIKTFTVVNETSDVVRYTCRGDIVGLQILFSQRLAEPNAVGSDGWTLLHNAGYYEKKHTVKFLLDQGADHDVSESGLRKPSDFAKFRALNVNASEEAKELHRLFPNADEFKDDYQLSPILVAVLHEYDTFDRERPKLSDLLDFADRLNNTNKGVDEDWHSWRRMYKKRSPLYREIIESYREAALAQPQERRINQSFVNMPDAKQRWSPVLWASFAGRTEELQTLLDYGADPFVISSSGRNAIHHGAESRNPETVGLLLNIETGTEGGRQKRIDIHLKDNWEETSLHIAASKSVACTLLLLEAGAKVNALQENGQVPLHYAKLVKGEEKHKIIEVLSAYQGVDVNVKDEAGRTPLFEILDDPDSVNLLLDRGADVRVRDKKGKTVIHHACLENQPVTLRALLDRSSDVLATQEDKTGSTPLLDAFGRSSVRCAWILLERKLWGRFKDKNGWSLAHHAANMQDDDVLELALGHPDAHPDLETRKGESVVDIAMNAGEVSERAWKLLRGPGRPRRWDDGREYMDVPLAYLEMRR